MTVPKRLTKVSLFLAKLDGSGVPRVMINLAEGFRKLDCKVELIVGSAAGAFSEQAPDGVNVHDLGVRRALLAFPGLTKRLRATRPDLLISAEDHSNLVAVAARHFAQGSATKLAVTGHVRFNRPDSNRILSRGYWVLRLIPKVYPSADLVTTVSAGLADNMAEEVPYPRSKITVIPNAVLSERVFRMAEEDPGHPWLSGDQGPIRTVVAVGRLSNAKNFALLIDAVARIPHVRALILGEGPLRSDLEAQIAGLGLTERVSLLGFQANPYCFMRRADAFVLSSRFEGLPTVLIEALALGVPVVSTDCPHGPREIIEVAGSGVLVQPGDPGSLAAGILSALSSGPPAEMSDHMTSIYGPAAVARRYLNALGIQAPDPISIEL